MIQLFQTRYKTKSRAHIVNLGIEKEKKEVKVGTKRGEEEKNRKRILRCLCLIIYKYGWARSINCGSQNPIAPRLQGCKTKIKKDKA